MSPKELTAFRLAPEVMAAMRRLKDRDGIPFSVQVDRALRAWLKNKEIEVKDSAHSRAGATRKGSRRERP